MELLVFLIVYLCVCAGVCYVIGAGVHSGSSRPKKNTKYNYKPSGRRFCETPEQAHARILKEERRKIRRRYS